MATSPARPVIPAPVWQKFARMSSMEGFSLKPFLVQLIRLRYEATTELRKAAVMKMFTSRSPRQVARGKRLPRGREVLEVSSVQPLLLDAAHVCTESNVNLHWTLSTSPRQAQQVEMTLLKGFLTETEVQGILQHVPKDFDLDRADVEMVPKRWIMLERAGKPVGLERAVLVEKTRPYIQGRLLPYLRSHLNCPTCVVCSSIMRRYSLELGERYRDPPHTDGQAFATVVIALNTAGKDYHGGLYVVSDPHRPLTVALNAGDAVLHRWDLQHGVEVTSGERLSWILWLQDQAPCVSQVELHQRSFLRQAAEAGNVVAMQILGTGENGRTPEGRQWLQEAAEAGLPGAMMQYAKRLTESGQEVEALHWLRQAAEQGDVGAQASLGMRLLRSSVKEAEEWLRSAADMGNPVAQHDLGMALYTGAFGRGPEASAAHPWLERAARQGHAAVRGAKGTTGFSGRSYKAKATNSESH
eukprot:symbB.v1.2.012986.t1/scaffold909.1/size153080/5